MGLAQRSLTFAILCLILSHMQGCIWTKYNYEAFQQIKTNNKLNLNSDISVYIGVRESNEEKKKKFFSLYTIKKFSGPYIFGISINGIDTVESLSYAVWVNNTLFKTKRVKNGNIKQKITNGKTYFSVDNQQINFDWRNVEDLKIIVTFSGTLNNQFKTYQRALYFSPTKEVYYSNIIFDLMMKVPR